MRTNPEHAAFRDELRNAARDADQAQKAVAAVEQRSAASDNALMETMHRLKCAGLSWHTMMLDVCDALGLPRSCATSLEGPYRRQLTEWRADNGLLPCPPPRVRTTTIEEFG